MRNTVRDAAQRESQVRIGKDERLKVAVRQPGVRNRLLREIKRSLERAARLRQAILKRAFEGRLVLRTGLRTEFDA